MGNTACQRKFSKLSIKCDWTFYVCFGFCVFWTVGDSCVGAMLVEDGN